MVCSLEGLFSCDVWSVWLFGLVGFGLVDVLVVVDVVNWCFGILLCVLLGCVVYGCVFVVLLLRDGFDLILIVGCLLLVRFVGFIVGW